MKKKAVSKSVVKAKAKKESEHKPRLQVVKEMHDIFFELYHAEGVVKTVIRSLKERVDIRDNRQPNLHEEIDTLEDALKRFAATKTKIDLMAIDIYHMRMRDDD